MFLANSLSIMLLAILEPIHRLSQDVVKTFTQQITGRPVQLTDDIIEVRVRPPPLME
jgi:hypothetical protein